VGKLVFQHNPAQIYSRTINVCAINQYTTFDVLNNTTGCRTSKSLIPVTHLSLVGSKTQRGRL